MKPNTKGISKKKSDLFLCKQNRNHSALTGKNLEFWVLIPKLILTVLRPGRNLANLTSPLTLNKTQFHITHAGDKVTEHTALILH